MYYLFVHQRYTLLGEKKIELKKIILCSSTYYFVDSLVISLLWLPEQVANCRKQSLYVTFLNTTYYNICTQFLTSKWPPSKLIWNYWPEIWETTSLGHFLTFDLVFKFDKTEIAWVAYHVNFTIQLTLPKSGSKCKC